jgi:hypothetical protein
VGIPLPPGLQDGNTQTGFHPFMESSTLSAETPGLSNVDCATDKAENKIQMQNPAKTLYVIFMFIVSESWREILSDRSGSDETVSQLVRGPIDIGSTCGHQKYMPSRFVAQNEDPSDVV